MRRAHLPSGGPPSRLRWPPRFPEPALVLSVPSPLAPAWALGSLPSSFFSSLLLISFSLVRCPLVSGMTISLTGEKPQEENAKPIPGDDLRRGREARHL